MSALRATADEVVAALSSDADVPTVVRLLDRLADDLRAWCVEVPHGLSMKGIEGAPDWYSHETSAWRLCEEVREATRSRYGRKIPRELSRPLERIVGMSEAGKGRGAWAAFAVDVDKGDAARRMAVHLLDDEVNGVVFEGLRKYTVTGFEEVAREVAQGSAHLPRREAKKYLAKLDADTRRPAAE